MSPDDRWRRIEALFAEGADLPEEQRAAWLDLACSDPGIRAEVGRLLDADHAAGDDAIRDVVSGAMEQAAEGGALPGTMVGPWRLIREIGRGGMGTVYLAERADGQYRGQAAVKFVRGVLADPARRERFLAERQFLADLDHPSVARLLDAGNASDGTPYFVMEYVDGRNIVEYADARGLGLTERIELFRRTCDAVQHAHESLVIHRDLKPSNILITADGSPKLVDFGIAKLLDAGLADGESATITRALTPAYASPEQVLGRRVTVQTDVYSLGVVLYRLLTGALPFAREPVTPGELEAMVVHTEPVRPSTAAGAPQWRRALQGDLDTVLLTALAKDPARRYPSVAAFAEDLRRYLAGEPVSARRDSWTYRTRKFMGRHRAALAATAALVVLVASLVVFYTVQLTAERDRARLAARQAEQVSAFLTDLFAGSDPTQGGYRDLSARQLLDRGAARLDSTLADDPRLRSRLLGVIGAVYVTTGQFRAADSLLQRALALRRTVIPKDDSISGAMLTALTNAARLNGHPATADSYAVQAAAIWRRSGPPSLPLASSLLQRAEARREMGDFAVSESLYVAALRMRERLLGPEQVEVADVLNDLSLIYQAEGNYAEAFRTEQRALELRQRLLGPGSWAVYNSEHNMASILNTWGRYAEAETWAARAVRDGTTLLGTRDPRRLNTLGLYGNLLARMGRYAASDSVLREAATMLDARPGLELRVAAALRNWSRTKSALGQGDSAVTLARRGLALTEHYRGPGHPETLLAQRDLAMAEAAAGDTALARTQLETILAAQRRVLGAEHPEVKRTEGMLAGVGGSR